MRNRIFLGSLAAAIFTCAAIACAQDDSPSLGDIARQTRQQKQQKDAQVNPDSRNTASKDGQSKDSQSKDAQSQNAADAQAQSKTKHVITNDEIPSRNAPAGYRPTNPYWNPNYAQRNYGQPSYGQPNDPNYGKVPAQNWTEMIQRQKNAIATAEKSIDEVSSSIQYAGGNCVSNCVQWNQEQKKKQDRVELMKAQLEQYKQQLDQAQEQCRQQGYGGTVCDP